LIRKLREAITVLHNQSTIQYSNKEMTAMNPDDIRISRLNRQSQKSNGKGDSSMLTTLQRYIPEDIQTRRNDPELNKYIVLNYYAALDRYGKQALRYFLADDFTTTMTGFEGRLDQQSFSDVIGMLYSAIQSFRHEIIEISAEDNMVRLRTLATGVHTGELLGIPATRRSIAVPGRVALTLKDNRIVSGELEFDLPLLMQQLGVLPVEEAQYA
jgi:predicted ester cyclase